MVCYTVYVHTIFAYFEPYDFVYVCMFQRLIKITACFPQDHAIAYHGFDIHNTRMLI